MPKPSLTTLPLETTKRGGLRAPSFGFLPRLLNFSAPVLRPYFVTDEALDSAHLVRPGPELPAFFQTIAAPPLPHFRTDSTQIYQVEDGSPKGGMWTSPANETAYKFCKGDIRPRGRTVRPKY